MILTNSELNEILKELGEIAEGIHSTKSIELLATKHSIYTPIAKEVSNILNGKSPKQSIKELLSQ